MEEFLRESGIKQVWGMIGGNCGLCAICKVKSNEPCLYPDKARMSLEAIAVDVVGLLDKFGLDSKFHADKIIWTGCILF
jgi:predicted metal-binding protein